jgi:hypothetical protein
VLAVQCPENVTPEISLEPYRKVRISSLEYLLVRSDTLRDKERNRVDRPAENALTFSFGLSPTRYHMRQLRTSRTANPNRTVPVNPCDINRSQSHAHGTRPSRSLFTRHMCPSISVPECEDVAVQRNGPFSVNPTGPLDCNVGSSTRVNFGCLTTIGSGERSRT